MAEAVGLIASAVAIVGIAGTAAKLSESLYRTARSANSAKDDIETLALHIGAFSSVLMTAHVSIKRYSNSRSRSTVADYVEEHQVLETLLAQSDRVTQHIKKLRPQVKAIPSSISLISRLKWLLQKTEVLALYPEMESVKTNIILLILTLRLGAIQEGIEVEEKPEDTAEEIKLLRRQIRVQVHTIEILQERQKRFDVPGFGGSTSSFHSAHSEANNALVNLAERMVYSKFPESTSSFSSPRSRKRPVIYFPNDRETIARKERPTIHVDRRGPSQQHAGEVFDHSERRPMNESRTDKRLSVSPLRITPPQSQPGPSSTPRVITEEHSQESPIQPSPPVDTEPIPPPVARPRVEGDYVAVRPASYLLELDVDGHEGVEGYINTSKGPVPATANLDPKFGENLISGAYAAELGLTVEPLDDDDEEEFRSIGRGKQVRKVGKVRLEWSNGLSSHRRPFPVHCWVCEHNIRPLIFGQPFVERKRHYWGSRSNSDGEQTSEREEWVEVERPSAVQVEGQSSQQHERGQVTGSPTSSRESHRLRRVARRVERDSGLEH